jgi:PIN domain nuclease of toxin-antitoxin system
MIDTETLEKLRNISITERIALIEMLLDSLKPQMTIAPTPQTQRPAFGFMQNTGTILGDVMAPMKLLLDTHKIQLPHQDPFIAATAIHHQLTLATADTYLTSALWLTTLS